MTPAPACAITRAMTDRIALCLAILIVAIFLADALFFGGHLPVFLLTQLSQAIEYLEFWH